VATALLRLESSTRADLARLKYHTAMPRILNLFIYDRQQAANRAEIGLFSKNGLIFQLFLLDRA